MNRFATNQYTLRAMEVSIVMPCLNEAETLQVCLKKANKFLEENKIIGEVIVADNGSTDGSQEIAIRNGARLIQVPEKGYGSALMSGSKAAAGKYIIMGDSDDSYDFTNLMPYLEKLREGNDLVMGNRFKGGIMKGAMPFLHRYLGNPVLSFIGRLFFNIPVRDFHCGLRGYSKDAFNRFDLKTKGMEFASEMVVKASLCKMKITEVPTILYPDGRSRPPHLRTWRDGWRHLRFLLIYSPKWLFLYPGILLMLLGVITSAILVIGRATFACVVFDVHTLLYTTSFIMIGFQFVSFFVFTKVFAITNGLLPASPNFEKTFKYFNLERGLVVGFLILLTGIIFSVNAILSWKKLHFGPLEPTIILRQTIPAVMFLTIGVQSILYSFFLSVLGLKK